MEIDRKGDIAVETELNELIEIIRKVACSDFNELASYTNTLIMGGVMIVPTKKWGILICLISE